MPAQYTLPPDTRAQFQPDPAADMNSVVDAVSALGAGVNVLNAAFAGGADPTGVNDSSPAWQAALNAIPASGGYMIVPPGTYNLASTVTNAVTPTYIICPGGRWATKVNFTGTGDCIRIYNPSGSGTGVGGGITGLTIDGTSAGNSSTGLHIGDGSNYQLDVVVQNFAGTSSIGVHFDNTVWWTEKIHGIVYVTNNTRNVVFDVTGATTSTNSFGYMDLRIWVGAQAGQDGVVLQNGALIYHSALEIRGNFESSSSVLSNYVLRLTGTVPAGHPAAGAFSRIWRSRLDIGVECSTAGAHSPGTIFFNTSAQNTILGCYGIMEFGMNQAFTASNLGIASNASTLWYSGIINGDNNLNPGSIPLPISVGGHLYSASTADGSNGNIFIASGDFFKATLSASITVNLNASTNVGAPRRVTIVYKQAAAGGPFTVAWPHSGAPTTSSPTVLWAGGSAPTMTATAGAVDVYKLETVDGATWYGQAIQNVS